MSASQAESHLEALPTELKIKVLRCLRSVSSLKSLTHSSPRFYNAYHSEEYARIFEQVVENELGSEVFKEAWFVIRAARHLHLRTSNRYSDELDDTSRKALSELLRSGRNLDRSELGITLEDIIWFSKKLPALQEMTMAFFKSMLENHPITGERIALSSLQGKSPSKSEFCRIQRAFLRIEAFTYLFSLEDHDSSAYDQDPSGPFKEQELNRIYRHDWNRRRRPFELSSEQQALFLDRYEEWEIEEMICVREWYRREYSLLYEQYPKEWKDVWIYQEWIDGDPYRSLEEAANSEWLREKDWVDWENVNELSMSKGFELLAEVKRKETGKEKVNLIYSAIDSGAIYFIDLDGYLSITLEEWNILRTKDATREDISIQTLQKCLREQSAWDESGSNAAWCWVRRQWERDDRKWSQTGKCLRSWGYVMWDAWRLDALGIFRLDVDEIGLHGPKKFGELLFSERTTEQDDE
ncbi:uncharacterized protein EAF01_004122 [Botrytis porri]|uniref:F-box domain-containing protein n=1 Tax=Botrytis porri TaxID=87229 RepID=A0A4Z1KGY7_9HELO|nr:uncharacterized protein EAF01_004122 [Botrytis porri]KAF7908367.1 hypothetical protein EAF01_004122 [Botrytis porri]TGO85353.1 hypothetical protein BPOR_0404g00010 [Botrytis porri]